MSRALRHHHTHETPVIATVGNKCFCGERARYGIADTAYRYCEQHAMELQQQYRSWFRIGGQSQWVVD